MKGFLKSEEDVNPLEEKHPKRKRFEVFGPRKKEYDYEVPEGIQNTPCQCKMSGNEKPVFCDRHQCIKTPSLQRLCKTRMDYFEMWEKGKGPMQDPVNKMITEKRNQGIELMDQEGAGTDLQEVGDGEFFMGDIEIPSESRGLGDTMAKITKATGIKKAVDTVFGAFNKDCGCRERQGKLNKLFPYKKQEGEKRKTKGFFE